MDEAKQMIAVEIVEGVRLLVDPEKWEINGVPLSLNLPKTNMKLSLDLNVFIVAGQQDSKIENLIQMRRV